MDTQAINHSENRKPNQNFYDSYSSVFGSQTDEAQLGIISFQANHVFYANPYVGKISGYSNQELLEMQFIDLIHPDSKSVLASCVSELFHGSKQFDHLCLQAIKKTGKEYWMDVDMSVFTLNGEQSILAILFDISEQTDF